MTIQKFRKMDLIFLISVAILSDLLLSWFGLIGVKLFISIAYPIIVISYIRWNIHGIYANLMLMLAHLLFFGVIVNVGWQIAILHSLATLGFVSILIIIKLTKQENNRVSFLTYLLIYVTGFFTVFLLEWALFNLFDYQLNLLAHSFNHIINFIFGFLIITITFVQKDILVNMKYYLINKDKEV